MNDNKIKIFCDGGARGNPGPAAAAFAVVSKGEILHKDSKYLGKTTNNVAEYKAVIMGLEWLRKNEREEMETVPFILDSELVTKQLSGLYKIKSETLKPLVIKAKELERQLPMKVSYNWFPRKENKIADKLVNEELDRQK